VNRRRVFDSSKKSVQPFCSMMSERLTEPVPEKNDLVFKAFCIWTFVLLCRPQDIFPTLSVLKPASLTGALTLLVYLLGPKESLGTGFFESRQVKLYSLLITVMIVGIPFSLYPRLSFMFVFTEYITVIVFFFVFSRTVNSTSKLRTILLLSCMGSGLYSGYSLISGEFRFDRLYFGRVFDPNDLAFFSLAFLPYNLLFIVGENPLWKRIISICALGCGSALIIASGSRGGIIAFGVALSALIFTRTTLMRFSRKVMVLGFVAAVILWQGSEMDLSRFSTLTDVEQDYNVWDETGRVNIWKIGMKAMLEDPLTGVGVGRFSEAVGRDRARRHLDRQAWQAPHNMLVQIGTETGVLGLCAFILASFNVFILLGRAKREEVSDNLVSIAQMGMIGFLGLFVSGMFLSHAYSVYWAFYVAFSAVVEALLKQEKGLDNGGTVAR
jgi:O-antigen ligase